MTEPDPREQLAKLLNEWLTYPGSYRAENLADDVLAAGWVHRSQLEQVGWDVSWPSHDYADIDKPVPITRRELYLSKPPWSRRPGASMEPVYVLAASLGDTKGEDQR